MQPATQHSGPCCPRATFSRQSIPGTRLTLANSSTSNKLAWSADHGGPEVATIPAAWVMNECMEWLEIEIASMRTLTKRTALTSSQEYTPTKYKEQPEVGEGKQRQPTKVALPVSPVSNEHDNEDQRIEFHLDRKAEEHVGPYLAPPLPEWYIQTAR